MVRTRRSAFFLSAGGRALGGLVELGLLANASWLANRDLWARRPLGTGPFAQLDLVAFFPVVVPRTAALATPKGSGASRRAVSWHCSAVKGLRK